MVVLYILLIFYSSPFVLKSRPYHNPLSPSQDLLTGLINVRVVWPSAPRYFQISRKLHPVRLVTGVMYALSYRYRISFEVRKTLRIHEQNFQDKFSKFQNFRVSEFRIITKLICSNKEVFLSQKVFCCVNV